MGKRFSLFFALLLIFQTVTSSLAFPSQINAEGKEESIFKNVLVKDEDGQDVSIEDIEGELAVDVHVDWSISGLDVESGNTDSMKLQDPFEIMEKQEGTLTVEEAEESVEVGTFEVATDGTIVVTFAEAVEEHADVNGTMVVEAFVEGEKDEEKIESEESSEENNASEATDNSEENTDSNDNADEGNNSEANDTNDSDIDEESNSESNENNDPKETNDKGSNDDSNADEEKAEESEADSEDDDNATEENSEENNDSEIDEATAVEKESDKKTNKAVNNDEKHGFNLELDKIMDLDDEAFDEQHPMDPHKEFKVKLDWELEDGHTYVEDDTATFDLPKGIKIQKNIEIELKDEHGQVIANATVTPDKKVELTFTDFVEGHSAVSGWMEIISELDISEVEEEDGEIVIDPIGEEGELRVPIEKSNKDKTIEKKGEPNKGYNADEINWEVIVNKNKSSLKNATITDVLPEGTKYKDGSLKVTKLDVDLNGNVRGDLEEVEITPEFNENGELIVPLGDTNDAYRVEYVTEVTDDEEKTFKNNATMTDEELDDVSADSRVTINRGEPLKKGAVKDYDPKTGIIEWYLEFNYNQKDLNDVTLEDNWKPAGKVEFVEGSLSFQEMTIDEKGNAEPNGDPVDPEEIGATPTKKDDGFEVSGITTDKAYYVVYETKVTDRELDGFRMTNLASFGDNESDEGYNVGQYIGAKSAGDVDYAEKTIEWTIRVNMDHRQMNDVIIEDTIGEGLTLIKDSVEMTIGGQPKTDYKLENGNPFKLTNIGDTDEEIIVTYKTEFDADNVPDHIAKNKADITWTPEGEADSITKDVKAETELNDHTQNNDWKNGSYNPETKEITWEIITNYRENDIADLNIFDEPQGNQQIIDGSAEVKELNIAANGDISEGDSVDATTIDEDKNTLEVALGETNKAYKITYKTSLEGLDDMQDEYVNEAEVLDGDEQISEIDAKVGIVKDSKYGDKSGYQDGKQVHWSIDVNLVQQKIKDLKLVDNISDNQEYLEDSIKVYHANIDGNGNASKEEEVSSEAYTLDIDQDAGEFTVKWNDEVERAFIVEYSTLFFEKHNGEVKNEYTITGDSIEEEDSDASGSDNVTIEQLGSGGGEGTAGYLVIDKVDSTDGQEETSLEGAEFDLIDADTGNVLKSGTTDENGQIDFGRLLFGDYQLKETKVPEGYVTPEEEQTITIDQAYKPGDEKESFAYTVENYVPVFAVELSKTDDDNNALADAEFTLFDSDDNELQTKETNEDGKILFEDIKEAGTYYVQETKAPAGYVLDETKHEVTIGEKEQEPIKVTAENATRGNVVLTKTDVDTEEALEGVEFELQKKNDSDDYEKVETDEPLITDDKGQIQTENTLEAGSYQFVEVKPLDGYRTNGEPVQFDIDVNETETQEYEMTNEQHKGSIKLIKKDAATEDLLSDAEFKLVDADGEVVEENLKTNAQGEIIVEDLFLGEYQLIETKAPAGYELDKTPIDVKITEDKQVVEEEATNNQITNISVEKKWNNGDGDTEPVTVKLLPTEETEELNEENDWTATFEGLRVYDDSGGKIEYTVEEFNVDGYQSDVTGDADNGFIVTNTELTDITFKKTWLDDDLSKDRPEEITIKLLADGEEKDKVKINGLTDEETYTFENLPKYDANKKEVTYKVEEVEVDGYETKITNSDTEGIDFDIENLRAGTTEVEGTKIWKDEGPESRPESIAVNLLKNGEVVETQEVTAEDDWKYSFTGLDAFDEDGLTWGYTVDEEPVEGYEKSADGNDLINTRTGITEVSGEKAWLDENISDRPDSIKVNLLQNGVVFAVEEVIADENGDWAYSFNYLPEFDSEGKAYEYSVKEHDVPGYASKVNGFKITNTRTDEKTIEITKTWLDDNYEGRPNEIEVELFRSIRDGEQEFVDTHELKADSDWSLEIKDLPAFDEDGKAYTYEIEERDVDGYGTKINGFDITNLRVGKIDVSGEKTWVEVDAQYRPESITVKLLANGAEEDTIEVSDETDWKYTFDDLVKYDESGKEISYSIEEIEVPGYITKIDGFNITNTQETTEISGEKTWIEADDQYRPDSITVQILANGEEEASFKVSEATGWKYIVTDLIKYDSEGKEIEYTIEEVDVPNYTSEVDGFDITNTQEVTKVKGTKTWEDDDASDRPDTITVQLLANGDIVDEMNVTAETDWTYAFTDLPAFDENGTAIEYTIDEASVDGYEATINGYDLVNTFIPEDPEDPKDSQDPEKPEDPESPSKQEDKGEGEKIPKTATNVFNFMLIGFGLVLVGFVSLFVRRRKDV